MPAGGGHMLSGSEHGLKAVLVDFGGVLYRTPNPRWLPMLYRLLRTLRLVGESSLALLEMMRASPGESPLVMDVMTGRVPEPAVWAEAARAFRISPARLERMRQSAYHPQRLNHSLLGVVDRLRPRYKTALLTNAGSDFRRTFVAHYRLESHFNDIIISAEEGLAKPNLLIYYLAAGRLGIAPEEALFIDDLAENVAGAQAAGMQAVVYPGLPETLALLQKLAP